VSGEGRSRRGLLVACGGGSGSEESGDGNRCRLGIMVSCSMRWVGDDNVLASRHRSVVVEPQHKLPGTLFTYPASSSLPPSIEASVTTVRMTYPSLSQYLLRHHPPPIVHCPDISTRRPSNTKSDSFSYEDILPNVPAWSDFTFTNLAQRFHAELQVPITAPAAIISPPRPIRTEMGVNNILVRSVYVQVARALRVTKLFGDGVEPKSRIVDQDGQSIVGGSAGDRIAVAVPSNEIRLVGDIKPSWNWKSNWRMSANEREDENFRQVLSQVAYYMNDKGVRYGYVITDAEFVAVRRLGRRYGDVEVSPAVPWREGEMSVAFALWAVLTMAAEDDGWTAPRFARSLIPTEVSEDDDVEDDFDASGDFVQ